MSGPAWAARWEAYATERQVLIDERVAHVNQERAAWMAESMGGVLADHWLSSENERGITVDYGSGWDFKQDGSRTYGGRIREEHGAAAAT